MFDWHTINRFEHSGYTIEEQRREWAGGYQYRFCAVGGCFPSLGEAEMAIDNYVQKQAADQAKQGPNTEPPEEPKQPTDDDPWAGWGAERTGGGDWSGGGSGTPGGAGTAEQTTSTSSGEAQSSQSAQPAVPDWMQDRMKYWDNMQKQLLAAATKAYEWSGQQYTKAWSAIGTQGAEAQQQLQKGYGQALGMIAQNESQQQSALARYAATGRMSGGSAEQAMTSAAREAAKGAMGAYGQYAANRANLATSLMNAYGALGSEAFKYTQIVVDAMKTIPNPYEDWANFMAGLTGFSSVAVT